MSPGNLPINGIFGAIMRIAPNNAKPIPKKRMYLPNNCIQITLSDEF